MEKIKTNSPFSEKFMRYIELFNLTEADLDKSILDIGAGSGDFIQYLRQEKGNTEAYGVERFDDKIPPNLEGMIAADGLYLPFKDDTFELILAKNYLPMQLNKQGDSVLAINEILRILKKGGKFIGDISLLENEISNTNALIKNHGEIVTEKTLAWLGERQKHAKDLEGELFDLNQSGIHLNLTDKADGSTIFTIEK